MLINNFYISIIIINKNDYGIYNTLNALANISYSKRTEIIVVDSSDGNLNHIRNSFKNVKWIEYINNKNKKITISEQRNLGIKNSTGEYIVFLDANCIPIKNWLNQLVGVALKENEFLVAGGIKASNKREVNTIIHNYNQKYIPEAPTTNLLIDKRVFDKIGYFNEKGTYGEDVDFTWRAVAAGFKIRYLPEALIFHDMGNFNEQCKRMLRYGDARLRLYLRYKNKILKMTKDDFVMVVIYPLYIFLLPLTFIFPFYPIFLIVPIIKNIKNKPLKNTCYNLFFGLGVLKALYFQIITGAKLR